MANIVVRGKKGVLWLALCGVLSIATFAIVFAAIDPRFWTSLHGFVLFSVVLALVSVPAFWLHFVSEQVKITETYIHMRSLIISRKLYWKDVESIAENPAMLNLFSVSNLIILAPERGKLGGLGLLNTFLYSNGRELARAALEAAYLVNPDVNIAGNLIGEYGVPPYDIFDERGLHPDRFQRFLPSSRRR